MDKYREVIKGGVMYCELKREVFADVLGSVAQIVPVKSAFPLYQNILLEISAGKLKITGSDGDVFLRREMTLEGRSKEGGVLIRGQELNELVRQSPAEDIIISEEEKGVVVKAGKLRAYFTKFPREDFPSFPEMPADGPVEFPLALLFEMFDRCSFAVSSDDSRPVLTSINWEILKNESVMVATDSYRLACVSRKLKSNTRAKLLVSPKVISALPRGEDKVKVFFDPKMVGLQLEGMTVIARMVEGPYPDYERVIPKGYPNRAVVNRDELLAGARRAAVIARPIGRQLSLEFKTGSLVVRAENPDLGKSEEELECEYQGEQMTVGFNGNFLMETLRHISSEKVQIETSNPMAPVLFKPAEMQPDAEDLFILMPIRLD